MRHQVTPATDSTGIVSSSAPCVPACSTPATRPHAAISEASFATPTSLSSLLPPTTTALIPANVSFRDLAGLSTFDEAIVASRVHSQPNISAKADAEGQRLLSQGLGFDHTIVAFHVSHVKKHGLLHLLQKCSDSLRHRAFQPVSKRRDPPSCDLPLFPVCSATRATKTGSTAPLLPTTSVPARGVTTSVPNGATAIPVADPSVTTAPFSDTVPQAKPSRGPGAVAIGPPDPHIFANLELFNPMLTQAEKFQLVADHGAPILLRNDFVPNGCTGVAVLPPSIAPPAAIEAHFAKEQRKGLAVILPMALVQERCTAEGLQLCGSNAFIGGKVDAPLGRLVSDYKNTPGGGPKSTTPASAVFLPTTGRPSFCPALLMSARPSRTPTLPSLTK